MLPSVPFQAWWLAAIGAPPPGRAWAIVLGVVFAIIAISLLVASWTRWGQTKPLAKCVGIAVLAHIWLLLYAYGTRIVSPGFGPGSDGGIHQTTDPPASFSWHGANDDSAETASGDADQAANAAENTSPRADTHTPVAQAWETSTAEKKFEQIDAPKLPGPDSPANALPTPMAAHLDPLLSLPESRSDNELMSMADLPIDPTLAPPRPAVATPPTPLVATQREASLAQVPSMYRMRLSPDRAQYAASQGGDANTETAVANALAWLARAQSQDGSWNAAVHGAGSPPRGAAIEPEGQYRADAGRRADTAMTGLALLAFLGAGHTHRDSPYADNVQQGLKFLIAEQFPSGDLSGRSQIGQEPTVRYARMYSHGMASLALAEAYAMTRDPALLTPVQSAASYTLHAVNPRSGGWRYDFASDDPGDTSQFGWQVMFLNSAAKGGAIAIPGPQRLGFQRFLDSVSTGRHGGLAVYRNVSPGVGPSSAAATPAMTAEAMAMRCMLELPIHAGAADEARNMILAHLPGRDRENLYYWYYAALMMHQLRSAAPTSLGLTEIQASELAWQRWNDAMKLQLCGTQIVHGPDAGSWNPTCVWGSYGGRVYATATACMCLEVYYRYMTVYQTASRGGAAPTMAK